MFRKENVTKQFLLYLLCILVSSTRYFALYHRKYVETIYSESLSCTGAETAKSENCFYSGIFVHFQLGVHFVYYTLYRYVGCAAFFSLKNNYFADLRSSGQHI